MKEGRKMRSKHEEPMKKERQRGNIRKQGTAKQEWDVGRGSEQSERKWSKDEGGGMQK